MGSGEPSSGVRSLRDVTCTERGVLRRDLLVTFVLTPVEKLECKYFLNTALAAHVNFSTFLLHKDTCTHT